MGPLVVPAARAVSTAVPAVVEKVREVSPEVIRKTREWLAQKMGVATVSVSNLATDAKSAPIVLEGMVRNGLPVNELTGYMPVLSKAQHAAMLSALTKVQEDVLRRNEERIVHVAGTKVSAMEAAVIHRASKMNVALAGQALGCATITQLRARLAAIRSITDVELASIMFDSGELLSNIDLQGG